MAIPESDLMFIRSWCENRVPEQYRDQVWMETEETNRHVTVVEVRPPWNGVGENSRFPIARFRYTATRGEWSLYWRDSNLKFHPYDIAPSKEIAHLIYFLENCGDPIFFG